MMPPEKPAPTTKLITHQVSNQPPPLADYNAFDLDQPLQDALQFSSPSDSKAALHSMGSAVGDTTWITRGFQANNHPPLLNNFDRFGQRIDEIDYHPAYHQLMTLGTSHGTHSVAWTADENGHATHGALQYLLTQLEPGVCCPIAMTHAAVPVLRQFEPTGGWAEKCLANDYNPCLLPSTSKTCLTVGMAMTEKQGGSDVRCNSTEAIRVDNSPDTNWALYRLKGHKWFCSAPMSDAFLTLAQTASGLTCFLVPRVSEDGERNRVFIQRLKNKLGNRSNASSEIEYHDAFATRLGAEGQGVNTIIEMVQHTRYDAACAAAGLMRQAMVQAIHHTRHRNAFGKPLVQQPLMLNVLADLALESEAATALIIMLGHTLDQAKSSQQALQLSRVLTIVAKFWLNKRAPQFVYEAMECLGGAGYIEESILPRLYREAPLNSIWEGSGNIMCLDLIRVMQREPACIEACFTLVRDASVNSSVLTTRISCLRAELTLCHDNPSLARRCLESLAVVVQTAALAHCAPGWVVDAFLDSRLNLSHFTYGTLPEAAPMQALVDRAWPV